MNFLFVLLFSLFPFTYSMASNENYGFYTGLNFGKSNDTGKGKKQISGSVMGTQLGYRLYHWAMEVGYNRYSMTSGKGPTEEYTIVKGRVEASSIDFLLRTYFWRFFTAGIGWNNVKSKEVYYLTNVGGDPNQNISYNDQGAYKGLFYNAGIVLPLFRWLDIWVLYENRNWISEKYNGSTNEKVNLSIQQLSAHAVYYFN